MKPTVDDPVVSVHYLKKTKLWRGSIEQAAFEYGGGLLLSEVRFRRDSLEQCDDLTPDEIDYLIALNDTIREENRRDHRD